MKKLNCLLVHNGLKKCSPSNAGTSPTPQTIFPKPSAFWLWLHPRSFQPPKPSPAPHLGLISCWRQKAPCPSTNMHACAHAYMCVYMYTRVPFVRQKLRDIKKAFTQDSLNVHFAVNFRAGNLCILKGGRGECFLRDYYNHHHCNYHYHYLLIMDGVNNLNLLSALKNQYFLTPSPFLLEFCMKWLITQDACLWGPYRYGM